MYKRQHVDLPLPEFGGPMHGANEAAPIDKLLEAVKIYIIALLRLEAVSYTHLDVYKRQTKVLC